MPASQAVHERQLIAEDGTSVAYTIEGQGSALLLTNGLTTSSYFWKYLRPIWLRYHTVITWDLPGHGESSPVRSLRSASVEGQAVLMRDIMHACGVERALQIGWSTGCQLVLEMYRRSPEHCAGLALLFGPAGGVLNTTQLPLPGAWFAQLVRALPAPAFELLSRSVSRALLAPGAIALGRKLQLIGPHTHESDLHEVLSHIGRVDPRTLRAMLLALQAHSAKAVLPNVRVPLLIMAGDRDPFAPAELVGVPMHRAAPHSELVRLSEGTHTALLDEVAPIARAVEELAVSAFYAGR
jgi:pimeloyl-ACP methyl ester carboxylesterase